MRVFCLVNVEARWRSGDAEDCKSSHAGSIPARASRHIVVKIVCHVMTLKTPEFWEFSTGNPLFAKVDLPLAWEYNDSFSIQGFVTNVTNKATATRFVYGGGGNPQASYGPPRL